MKIHFYLLFIVLCGGSTLTAESSIKELLPELDDLLANKSFYVQEKEQRLNRLKIQLKQEVFPEKRYELCYRIVDEYKSYISDSALVYIEQNLKHAQKNKNNSWLIATQLQYSFVLSSSGLFIESETILKSISREKVPETFLVEYWKCFELLYTNVNIYQEEKRLVKNYPQMIRNYRDSILAALQHDSMKRHYYNYLIADSEHDFKKAEAFLKTYLATLSPGTHEHAKKNYNMALLCAKTNRKDLQVNYLIQSVESDIKDAIKENRALLDLAIWLYEHNDIERAFKYIHEALDDANFYNARFRYFEISTILPIITSTYQNMNTRQNSYLKITLTVISVLFIILLITMFFLYKQMLALKCTRKGLKEANDHLEKMNFKLNSLNHELSEVNLIKDEYLGHFLDLCSEYVANLQDYKRAIKNKIAAKRFHELSKMVFAGEKEDEVKDLYINFDKAFLKIYPGFISGLNELLREEARYQIKTGEPLNTELRVLALIRMGVTDPAQIASFLRCTVQTVYNYRYKVKRNIKMKTDHIEEEIKKIGKTTHHVKRL